MVRATLSWSTGPGWPIVVVQRIRLWASTPHWSSYARRFAADRTFATIKAPTSTDTTRGWTRVNELTAITLMLTGALVVRNGRIVDPFEARAAEAEGRTALGQPPKTGRRRRRSLTERIDTA